MILQDIRYAMRQMRRAPGFALTVVLTLALGVGVATAVFCVIDAVILRPLPFAHQERIVAIDAHSRSGYQQPASWPGYQDERAQSHSFAALAGFINYFQVHGGNAVGWAGAAGRRERYRQFLPGIRRKAADGAHVSSRRAGRREERCCGAGLRRVAEVLWRR